MKRAYGFETVLSNNNFSVIRSVVVIPTSPGYLMRLPPTVRQVRYGQYFGGATIQNNTNICYIFPSVLRYIAVGQNKTLCLCLTPCHKPLDLA